MNGTDSDYTFKKLIDIGQLIQLLECHYRLSGMGCFLLDGSGELLVSIGNQETCSRFHCVHPICFRHCREGDVPIKSLPFKHANDYHEYRCGNGMTGVATPIIIEGQHLATFIIGPFFYDDDSPDRVFFYNQALKFGSDPAEYPDALEQVPVFSRDHVRSNRTYLGTMIGLLAKSGLKSFKLEKELMQNRLVEDSHAFAGFALDQKFLSDLDAVNQVLQGTNDLKQMMDNVLEVVRSALSCDRVYLICPSEPDAEVYEVCAENIAHAYPGAKAAGIVMPFDRAPFEFMRQGVVSGDPVAIGSGTPYPIPETAAKRFAIRSVLAMAVYPKSGKAWEFGIHQCAYDRIWSPAEKRYLKEVSKRLGDTLTIMLTHRDLRMSEQRLSERERLLSTLFDNIPDFIVRFDTKGRFIFINQAVTASFGMSSDEFVGKTQLFLEIPPYDGYRQLHEAILRAVDRGEANALETMLKTPEGYRYFEVRHIPEKNDRGVVLSVLGIARDITEKKMMENSLKESEAQYRSSSNLLASIFESATNVSVSALDRQYRYLAFNRRHKEGMKYLWGEDIAVGMSILDAVAEGEYRDEIRELADKMLTGTSLSAEVQYNVVKDGREVTQDYNIHGSPIINDKGEIVGLTFFSFNISDRKKMEAELHRREQQYRTLAENSPGLIVRYDRECKRVYVNPAFTRISRIQIPEALGKSPADSWMKPTNVTAGEYLNLLRKVMDTGVPEEIILECPDPDTDQPSYHHFQIVAEKNDDGEILGCLAIDRDITRLRQTQLKLDKLVEVFPGVLYTICTKPDGTHAMTYASPRIKELLGLSYDDIAGDMRHVFSRIHPDDYDRHMESVQVSAQSFTPWHLEFRFLHPDKGEIWVESHSTPLRQPNGSIIWHGFLHDITDRKRNEAALGKKRRQLAELTSELSLAEERERQNIATMLHDHIGQTLLLGRIKLGTLAGKEMPRSQRKTVEEVKELLDQVTCDIHKLTVDLSPPILATAGLETALEWLGRKMEEDYGLFVEFENDIQMKALSDEIRSVVYQFARELLINVAKHAKVDSARVLAALDGDYYRLTVEDDGVGFDPAMLDPNSSSDFRYGLLSMQIRMERLGGCAIFESSPGKGSRMALLVPMTNNDVLACG